MNIWENRLTMKQPQYLFTTQSLSFMYMNRWYMRLIFMKQWIRDVKQGRLSLIRRWGGEQRWNAFFHVSFATTSVWFLLSQSERNKWLPLRNANASTRGDIPYLLTSFTYCNTYARIESTHYSERKTNQARSWMRKKCYAADNKPHTILFKHWNGRVTMKKTCEFGQK